MKNRLSFILSLGVIVSTLLVSCGVMQNIIPKTVTVSMVYGSEKKEWIDPLVAEYNAAKNKTASGAVIEVEATAMGSIESVNGILDGSLQPVVWSPASSVYLPVANSEWRKTHAEDLYAQEPTDLVISPVVIAMWEPMARALGWPEKSLGWADIANLAISDEGWGAFGYPEWGKFKFGHTHPNYSNSGMVSIIAEAYAGAEKQRGLTLDDLANPAVQQFMQDVESSIIHYGTSTGFFAQRMFERGPSYLSAAVLYENLIVAQENKRLSGESSQLPVVAIYPREGTFWANHPFVILNASWVSDEQKEAAGLFEDFLLARPQQLRAIELGFRPSDLTIPLTAPLDSQHGVDISQPQTILEVPDADVIAEIQTLWKQVKKPVDLVLLVDTSGSMGGDKISSVRNSLMQFLTILDDRDRVEIILFNSDLITLSDLSLVGEKRGDIINRVSGIVEGGDTSLYDGIAFAYEELFSKGDPDHIRSIVVLSDGNDTYSSMSLDDVLAMINGTVSEGGNAIKLFTIAFGGDADTTILQQLADPTGGTSYEASTENINKIYSEIATFF